MFCHSIRRLVEVIAEKGGVDLGMRLRSWLRLWLGSWEWIWRRTLAFEALLIWVWGEGLEALLGIYCHCQTRGVDAL